MKAAVWYGNSKLEIADLERPVITDEEVLIQVAYTGLCITDVHIIKGLLNYSKPPHVFGHEITGTVVEAGSRCQKTRVGDRIVVQTSVGCGLCEFCVKGLEHLCMTGGEIGFSPYNGGYAQYVKVFEKNVVKLPDQVTFEEAGIIESFICPVGGIYQYGIKPGDTVVIQGAGPAGLAFTQGVKVCGAGKIIVSGRRPFSLDMARKSGADYVVDTTKENLKEKVLQLTGGSGADISIETAGSLETIADTTKLVKKGGKIFLYGIPGSDTVTHLSALDIILNNLTIHGITANRNVWEPTLELVAKGVYNLKDLVTHIFELKDINAAIELLENKKENVIKILIKP